MTAADRITFDGDHPDELVLTGVTVHLERQSWHSWWGRIAQPSGRSVELNFTDLRIDIEAEDEEWLPVEYGPDLLGCTAAGRAPTIR